MLIAGNDLSVFDVSTKKDNRLSAAQKLDSSASNKRRNAIQPLISTREYQD